MLSLLVLATSLSAQSSLGVEVQVYPTGVIPGLRYDHHMSSRSSLYARLGYQLIDHRDLGVQDDETGSGYGLSIGYARHWRADRSGWTLLVKSDLWLNDIDWQDGSDGSTGTSDITVLQPTLQAEYGWHLSDHLLLRPSIALGLEWNVKTEGRPTGQGPILLVGLSIAHQWNEYASIAKDLD